MVPRTVKDSDLTFFGTSYFMGKTLQDFHQQRLKNESRVAIVNLGCVRNTVDSQTMMATLERKGHSLASLEGADAVIVNTCSFIESAKKESIDAILELIALKKKGKIKKVIVAGCLAERYGSQLVSELKEVDAFVGVQAMSPKALQAKAYLTPPHYAYLKICESCFNKCSFCVIPKIKGRFISRDMEVVLQDVRRFDEQGVKELNIVGQDITAYGLDIYRKKNLAELVGKIAREVKNIEWIRFLYAYPAHITDELLDVMAREPKICKYIDVPLQHISDKVLKAMNRRITKAQTIALIEKIRRKIPGVFLRTTFIVGFPGETKKDVEELKAFLVDHPFERVGVFTYSHEEGTKAYDLSGQVPQKVKEARAHELMKEQEKVAQRLHERLIGREMKILIEERKKDDTTIYIGRSEFDAPDVDGVVYVKSPRPLRQGQFVSARITQVLGYDLMGEALSVRQ
ncbi:MAG: 30S ribosomal protein S12 methylthiotransferase RimO [Candidatus Omnitrophica bacterium]|nr:30S ribosomal protein S12 methylthiotransferase RimO [Candidatus Omnitrophota bacterium]